MRQQSKCGSSAEFYLCRSPEHGKSTVFAPGFHFVLTTIQHECVAPFFGFLLLAGTCGLLSVILLPTQNPEEYSGIFQNKHDI